MTSACANWADRTCRGVCLDVCERLCVPVCVSVCLVEHRTDAPELRSYLTLSTQTRRSKMPGQERQADHTNLCVLETFHEADGTLTRTADFLGTYCAHRLHQAHNHCAPLTGREFATTEAKAARMHTSAHFRSHPYQSFNSTHPIRASNGSFPGS